MGPTQSPTARRRTASTARLGGANPATEQAPLVLGRYRLRRRLGAGAFGTVWRARDEQLERDVAVKIIPAERIAAGRFEQEVRAAARLVHPGIVTLYEAAADDEGGYLISELVRGQTLERMCEAGRLSDRDVLTIGIALCGALSYAHAQGVVHRDVKPSNVLVPERPAASSEAAKLTDFGVARVLGADSVTRTGEVVGTEAYMSPEQAEGLEVGAAADLYSLALVLYEALTGVNPVRTGTGAARARRLGAHLPPLRRQRRDLPRELGQGIDLALRPRPSERGSVEELRRALWTSADQVRDRPGVVTGAWPSHTGTGRGGDAAPAGFAAGPAADRPAGYRSEPANATAADPWAEPADTAAAPAQWPARALAAAASAGAAAWLAAHVLSPPPLTPAATALFAGVLVVALPRLGWLALATAFTATLAAQSQPGGALVIAIAALVPALLDFRRPTGWPLAAAAPALGAIGLGGAWPALAARGCTVPQRAALGITGWVWWAIVGALASPAGSGWSQSLYDASHHVLAPVLSPGMLAAAGVWGAAAVVLPWIRSERSLALDAARVAIWATALVAATNVALGLGGGAAKPAPATTVVGAVAGALVTLAPAVVSAWRARPRHPDIEHQVP